ILPRHAAIDEREQNALREDDAARELQVGKHALRPHLEAAQDLAHLDRHVVDRRAGVGKDDPLGGGMADITLVPERRVLQRRQEIAAHHTREPADALGQDGIALVRHRGAPLLLLAERLERLSDLGPLEDRKSTRLNSSHVAISYAVFCLKKKKELKIPNLLFQSTNITFPSIQHSRSISPRVRYDRCTTHRDSYTSCK